MNRTCNIQDYDVRSSLFSKYSSKPFPMFCPLAIFTIFGLILFEIFHTRLLSNFQRDVSLLPQRFIRTILVYSSEWSFACLTIVVLDRSVHEDNKIIDTKKCKCDTSLNSKTKGIKAVLKWLLNIGKDMWMNYQYKVLYIEPIFSYMCL